jgi:hypothetical protein
VAYAATLLLASYFWSLLPVVAPFIIEVRLIWKT